ncbi:hypothetical protein SLS62_000736 [Diatrype stigma]|uniref:Uncharacterized protein n=1 Tax=Diatrype stigma TaxID=117547 RepID=A0AAN9YWH3_9PEZI
MPPRGTRGARGGRSSRGGRGASAAASASASSAPGDDAPSQSNTHGDGAIPEAVSVGSTPSVQEVPRPRQSATPSATASRGGGGTTRFKPKNVRRDAAERQRLEQERNRDLASKIKQEEREQRAEERRARRGRGRGGAMSQRGFIRRTVTATGPFSGVPSVRNTDARAADNIKYGGGKPGGWGSRLGDIPHVDSLRYRPRRAHETRVNIDILSGFAEDVEDPETHYQTFRSGQKSGSLPMGLFRTEHQEEEVKVATAAELEAAEEQSDDDGDLFVDPLSAKDPQAAGVDAMMDADDDNEVWHAAPASAIKVKAEPGTEDGAMDVDLSEIPEATAGLKEPSSPELQKKKPLVEGGEGGGDSAVVAKEKEKRRERALQDPEVQHAVLDVQALLQELRLYKEGDEQSGQNKDGRMYLFQLPPILPPLMKPSGEHEDGNEQQEADPSAPNIKKEGGADEAPPLSTLPDGGRIGKLNVRRSGRVELDWGGTTLHLGMGTETEFLTSAVMLETREHPENPEALTGTGYGMGQVMGKFVLTPVWDEEGDWDPNLEEDPDFADLYHVEIEIETFSSTLSPDRVAPDPGRLAAIASSALEYMDARYGSHA